MAEEQPSLLILGGNEAPEELLTDAGLLAELTGEDFETLCGVLFDDYSPEELLSSKEEVADQIEDEIDIESEELDSILQLVTVLVRSTGRRDLIETQIQHDIESLGIAEDRAEMLARAISDNQQATRLYLLNSSLVDSTPELVGVNWTVEKIRSTSQVQGVNRRRIRFEFTVRRGDEMETMQFQADEGTVQYLFTQLGRLQEELSIGIDDLDEDIE